MSPFIISHQTFSCSNQSSYIGCLLSILVAWDGLRSYVQFHEHPFSPTRCYMVIPHPMTRTKDSCCGCPLWDEGNGGCVSSNPDWTATSYPWAKFFKSACPTAYSFPRDDRTSIFACSDVQLEADASESVEKNTQSCEIGAVHDLKVTTTL